MNEVPERTILVVDDSADDRAEIRRLLARQRPGYRVAEAATGQAGLDRLRADLPDCVVLDFLLPDMDGAEFIRALRDRNVDLRTALVPIVLLTGLDSDDAAVRVLGAGAQDYLVKDAITGQSLARSVDNAIEKFQIQRELDEERLVAESRSRTLEALRSELQENVAELSDAQKARERFLAVMSHEMRTPLNAIIGYADLLEMGIAGELNEAQRQHVARIRVGGRHLLDLINDVLDLARADVRKLDLDLRPVDVRAVVEEVAALLQSQAEAKGLTLSVDEWPEPLPPVQADLQRLRQVLTNLTANAIKFTESGSVTIRGVVRGDQVALEVVDTGIGIDEDVLPRVFDDFYQAKDELTREKGGSGLGLAIARRLAALMGGGIEVASEPGEGSTFTLTLPVAGGELRPEDVAGQAARLETFAASVRSPQSAPTAGAPVTAVVAFGQDAVALAGLEQQVQPGVRLVWTTDPDQVAALAVRERATLVVLDLGSASAAAWRAAYEMQEVPELAQTAVLLLPAIPTAASPDQPEGLDLGWVSLVPKPFTPEQLTRAVAVAAGTGDPAGGTRTYNVLVVDDDPDSRRVAASFLAGTNARIRQVADGETALIEMRRQPPDVVVLDLMMPVLDGFGVLAAMRTDPLLAGVPVVVLTAKSLSDAEKQFLARTTVRVLQKGEYRLADVAALVRRAAQSPQSADDE